MDPTNNQLNLENHENNFSNPNEIEEIITENIKQKSYRESRKDKCQQRITLLLSSIQPHLEGILMNHKPHSAKTKIIAQYCINNILSLRKKLNLIEILLQMDANLSSCQAIDEEGQEDHMIASISNIANELDISYKTATNMNYTAMGHFQKQTTELIFTKIIEKQILKHNEKTLAKYLFILNRQVQYIFFCHNFQKIYNNFIDF